MCLICPQYVVWGVHFYFESSTSSAGLDGLLFEYSLLFNTSHGVLIREKWNFHTNPFIPAWSFGKSLSCLLMQPGLKPFLATSKQ